MYNIYQYGKEDIIYIYNWERKRRKIARIETVSCKYKLFLFVKTNRKTMQKHTKQHNICENYRQFRDSENFKNMKNYIDIISLYEYNE